MAAPRFTALSLAALLGLAAGAAFAADLTEAQQAASRQEVIQTIQGMIAAEERLDADAVWACHADVPGYLWADVDGQLYDFAGTRKAWADYLANCARLKFTTQREEVVVLGPDVAWYLWHGAAEITGKDGAVTRVDPWTARYLCRRIGGAWKIVGGQESSLPPQPAPPPATTAAASLMLSRAHEHRLASTAVGDTFVIQVRLPGKYEPAATRYPVLYVLDADYWFGAASDVADYLPMVKEGPPMIVVGIAYGGTQDEWWLKRARDYVPKPRYPESTAKFPLAGGADRFQQFLATELFPFIEQNYAARADDRTVVGLSFGATFAVHTLFTRPELFQGYIILAPSFGWDKQRFFELEAALYAQHGKLPATVFCAIGEQDNPGMVRNWRKFTELIAGRGYEGLRWTSCLFPDETHISVYPIGLTRGLKTIHPPETPAKTAPPAAKAPTGETPAAPTSIKMDAKTP
jgi:predicted alpha/beta superfamily hydrolase/ketosteroid isomerase-like protein